MPGTIPKKRPDPSRRTKDCIRTSSIVRSFWRRGTGVGLREARGRLRLVMVCAAFGPCDGLGLSADGVGGAVDGGVNVVGVVGLDAEMPDAEGCLMPLYVEASGEEFPADALLSLTCRVVGDGIKGT